jgi:hypothetical protein
VTRSQNHFSVGRTHKTQSDTRLFVTTSQLLRGFDTQLLRSFDTKRFVSLCVLCVSATKKRFLVSPQIGQGQ